MITEFLSQKFDCFKRVRKTIGAELKMMKLVELLKLDKYKKDDIIYDIDNYENKYFLLLKGNVNVFERRFIIVNMKIKDFINYLKDIKEKEHNLIKLYRIIRKNIIEHTFDKFDIIEKYSFDCLSIKEHIDISKEKDLFIEEILNIGNRIQGDNINNNFKYEKKYYHKVDDNHGHKHHKKELLFKYNSAEVIKEFFSSEENRIHYMQNYSDKRYICTEDCILLSIEKDAFNKKIMDLDNKLFGEDGEMLSLYCFIFKDWKKEIINSIVRKMFHKRYLLSGSIYIIKMINLIKYI
jgi:hypothetical protein